MVEEIFNINKKNFSEWYNEILKVSDLVDLRYNVKGFLVYKPHAMQLIKKIYQIWEEELEKAGHKPVLFPLVIPPENFELEKEHVEGFKPEVFWITKAGDKKIEKLALRPTSETAFYQLYSTWIRSYSDLPLKCYQSCSVYRYETKATKPLIRGREFLWIEAHDVFETEKQALEQVKQDMEITRKVLLEKLGVPFIFFKRPEWDKFKGAVSTYTADTIMPDGRILQLPSTHYLGQKFAKAFNIKFADKDEEEKYPYQTCYGPGISRILSALISVHGDNKGLVLQFDISPVQIIIIPIIFDESKTEILEAVKKIKNMLKEYRVEIDNTEKRPGEKFYYWEMKGVPVRIEIGPKDVKNNQVVLVNRLGQKKTVKQEDLVKEIQKMSVDMYEELRTRAEKYFNSMINDADSFSELEKILKDKGGLVRVNFCSVEKEGEKCAGIIKEKTGGEVRGTKFSESEKSNGKCIICGKKSNCVVYVGRAY